MYLSVNGMQIYYEMQGEGSSTFVLIHGSFLSTYSWRNVMSPLAKYGKVIAYDRIAAGQTERPTLRHWRERRMETNPYLPESQADFVVALMDQLGIGKATLIGSSTGGTIALLTALRHPQRVQSLVLVGSMVYSGYPVSEFPAWLIPIIPNSFGALLVRTIFKQFFPRIVRGFWYDQSKLTDDILANYRKLFTMERWHDGLWELIQATHMLYLEARLGMVHVPALVITGAQDRMVPVKESIRLSNQLIDAGFVAIPNCGHLPHEECPQEFLQAIERFLKSPNHISQV